MAVQLLLVRRDDLISDVDSLSLYGFSAGFNLAEAGWLPQVPSESDQSLMETMTLRANGTSMDNLAANLQALDLKIKQVGWYRDPQELYGVWLRAQQLGETNARQALLLSARRGQVPLWEAAARDSFVVHAYGLALERMPYWESTAALTYTGSNILCIGGMFDYTTYGGSPGAVPGDQPARIASFQINAYSTSGPLVKLWVGFRTNRFGARANFQPVWNLTQSVGVSADTTTGNVDVSAQSGNKAVCTFTSSTSLLQRVLIEVQGVTANHSDQRGTFLVLLRAKLQAAGSVNARLTDGYSQSNVMAVRPRVSITSTAWQLYEMGTVQLPAIGRPMNGVGLDDLIHASMGVDAELISGTPGTTNLDLDCLILIPISEGYFTTDQSTATGNQGIWIDSGDPSAQSHIVSEKPDGARKAIFVGGLSPASAVPVRYSGGVPTGAGVMVVAAQRLASAGSVKGDGIVATLKLYPRWATLRGAS